MNPGPDTARPVRPGPPLALAAELAYRTSTAADPRPPEVRTTGTGRKRRAARRRAATVRG